MNKYKKLNKIIQTIGYTLPDEIFYTEWVLFEQWFFKPIDWDFEWIPEQVIIFNPEFIKCIKKKYEEGWDWYINLEAGIMKNLDNPIGYLYNLI